MHGCKTSVHHQHARFLRIVEKQHVPLALISFSPHATSARIVPSHKHPQHTPPLFSSSPAPSPPLPPIQSPSCQLSFPSGSKVTAMDELFNLMVDSEDSWYTELAEKLPLFLPLTPLLSQLLSVPLLISKRQVQSLYRTVQAVVGWLPVWVHRWNKGNGRGWEMEWKWGPDGGLDE